MTAMYYLPESPSTGREKSMFKQQATMALHTAESEWLLNSSGITLKTRKFMHFSKYVVIFTVEISLDIALSTREPWSFLLLW